MLKKSRIDSHSVRMLWTSDTTGKSGQFLILRNAYGYRLRHSNGATSEVPVEVLSSLETLDSWLGAMVADPPVESIARLICFPEDARRRVG
jgi:hypothetical protein